MADTLTIEDIQDAYEQVSSQGFRPNTILMDQKTFERYSYVITLENTAERTPPSKKQLLEYLFSGKTGCGTTAGLSLVLLHQEVLWSEEKKNLIAGLFAPVHSVGDDNVVLQGSGGDESRHGSDTVRVGRSVGKSELLSGPEVPNIRDRYGPLGCIEPIRTLPDLLEV